jgi:hypothetical protein
MGFIPFVLNDVPNAGTKSAANLAIGYTRAKEAASIANRGDKSAALGGTALGGGAVAVNAMVENESALPAYTQPNPAPATVAPVPAGNFNPMKVGATPNYIQPGTANPQPNAPGQVSGKNPMGL